MKKLAALPLQDTGVGFYRVLQPARFIKRAGLCDVMTLPFSGENKLQGKEYEDRVWMEICKGADVIWSTLPWTEADLLRILNLKKWSGAKWVVDIDDNLYAIPPDNPAAAKVASQKDMWELAFRLADGVTASVPMLAELFRNLNPQVRVQKNCLDFSLWDNLPDPPRRSGKVRVGWEGAMGHQDDLRLAYPALGHLVRDFDLELVAFGSKPERLFSEWHDWVPLADYPAKLKSLGLDVMLAPLVDSAYNRCKSNLRLLDASALSVPVVYSPTANYRGFPGMAASSSYDWYEAVAGLATDREARRRLGEGQNAYAKREYSQEDHVAELAAWMDRLPRKEP